MIGFYFWHLKHHTSKTETLKTMTQKTPTTLGCLLLLSACASTPGNPEKDRIVTPNSSAIVGPLQSDIISKEKRHAVQKTAKTTKTKTTTLKASPPPQIIDTKKTNSSQKFKSATTIKKPKQTPQPPLQAKTKEVKPPAKVLGSVSGKVSILGDKNKKLSARGVLLDLKPLGPYTEDIARMPITHAIDMKNKTYMPRYLTIQKEDSVSFLNKDKIKHNVFSSTGSNAFDLGTYSAGRKRDVILKESGIVKVYCNIHAEMATFISVSESGLSAISTEDGSYTIEAVPPGEYELKVWHIRGETTERIVVNANDDTERNILLDTANYKRASHQNKFGKKYNKNRAIFDDEFY